MAGGGAAAAGRGIPAPVAGRGRPAPARPRLPRRQLAWARAAGLAGLSCTSSTWTFATAAEREWRGGLWADRTVKSQYDAIARRDGFATDADLERIAAAGRGWAAGEDGWFLVPHAGIIARA